MEEALDLSFDRLRMMMMMMMMVYNIITKECLNTPHTALKWHEVIVIRFSTLKQNLGDHKFKGNCEVTTAVT